MFLFLYVQNRTFVERLSDLVKGALYPAVTDKQVRDQAIPLPPLPEQQRIAVILTGQMAAVERARAAAEARLEAAKALPAAYLRAVFDSPEAREWPRKRLGDLGLDSRNGLYKPDSFYGRGTPILKMFNIGRLDGSWNLTRVDTIELDEKEKENYTLELGDILINRVNSRELVGKCALVDARVAKAVYESKNMRLRFDGSKVDPAYMVACLNSCLGRHQIEAALKQIVGQATINRDDLNGLEFPVPAVADQKKIAMAIAGRAAETRRLVQMVEAELATINALPAALLRRAFNGEL